MTWDVVALGNIVADFIAAPVKKLPNWGELYRIEQPIMLNIGGNAAIFSTNAAKLGLKTSLVGKVGDDEIGEMLLTKLKAGAVDISQVKLSKTSPTSVTLAIANGSGERSFFHHFGANGELMLNDIDFKFLSKSKALLLCSYFLMPGLFGAPAITLLKRAKEKKLITFFDVAWDPSGKWSLDDILTYVDVFIPNETEILKLSNQKNISSAVRKLLDVGVSMVAVKMGSSGCYVENNKGEKHRLKAHKVKAIDTTGAGDAFNAGFVYGTLSGWDLKKIAEFANAAAAFSVTKLGGSTGAPTRLEVEDFIKF